MKIYLSTGPFFIAIIWQIVQKTMFCREQEFVVDERCAAEMAEAVFLIYVLLAL